jgi:hypothetical protein
MANTRTRNDWTSEELNWRDHYQQRPYFVAGRDFDYYRPAYRFGFDARDRYEGDEWSDIESDLSRDWEDYKDRGRSTWQQVKDAVRDAWDRLTGDR